MSDQRYTITKSQKPYNDPKGIKYKEAQSHLTPELIKEYTIRQDMLSALEDIGATWERISYVPSMHADNYHLFVGYRDRNFLLFLKPITRKLTFIETEWMNNWKGTVHVVDSVAEALRVVTEERG